MNTKLATRQIRLHEWAAIIKDCKASGQKVDIYCEQHGLSRDAYYYTFNGFARPSYTMRLSTHGVTGADGGKKKYPLNTSQKKSFTL